MTRAFVAQAQHFNNVQPAGERATGNRRRPDDPMIRETLLKKTHSTTADILGAASDRGIRSETVPGRSKRLMVIAADRLHHTRLLISSPLLGAGLELVYDRLDVCFRGSAFLLESD